MKMRNKERKTYTWCDIGFINTAYGKYWNKQDLLDGYKNEELFLVIPEHQTKENFTHLLLVDRETDEVVFTLARDDAAKKVLLGQNEDN